MTATGSSDLSDRSSTQMGDSVSLRIPQEPPASDVEAEQWWAPPQPRQVADHPTDTLTIQEAHDMSSGASDPTDKAAEPDQELGEQKVTVAAPTPDPASAQGTAETQDPTDAQDGAETPGGGDAQDGADAQVAADGAHADTGPTPSPGDNDDATDVAAPLNLEVQADSADEAANAQQENTTDTATEPSDTGTEPSDKPEPPSATDPTNAVEASDTTDSNDNEPVADDGADEAAESVLAAESVKLVDTGDEPETAAAHTKAVAPETDGQPDETLDAEPTGDASEVAATVTEAVDTDEASDQESPTATNETAATLEESDVDGDDDTPETTSAKDSGSDSGEQAPTPGEGPTDAGPLAAALGVGPAAALATTSTGPRVSQANRIEAVSPVQAVQATPNAMHQATVENLVQAPPATPDTAPDVDSLFPPVSAPPVPSAQPKQSRPWLVGVLASVLIVLLGLGGYLAYSLWFAGSAASQAKSGQCLQLTPTDKGAHTEKVSCDTDGVVWKVTSNTKADATCPSEAYMRFTEQKSSSGEVGRTVCMYEVLRKDHCYAIESETQLEGFNSVPAEVNCETNQPLKDQKVDPAQAFKVNDVKEGVADAKACPAPMLAVMFPEPAVTYCVANNVKK